MATYYFTFILIAKKFKRALFRFFCNWAGNVINSAGVSEDKGLIMKKWILLFAVLLIQGISAQVVYEPLYKDVYAFLGRLSQKGVIEFNDQIRPVSRKYIAEKLLEAGEKRERLTSLEKDELEFLLKDYYNEINLIGGNKAGKYLKYIAKDPGGRIRLFSYADSLFKLNVSPIAGYEMGSRDGKSYARQWGGAGLYGYLSNYIGFSFDYRDNSERGDNLDRKKAFTPVTGITTTTTSKNNIQYSEVRTSVTAGWSWGSISLGKDFLEWGYGESGLLVLSQKAPSFPFVRLDISPVEWLRFNYIHAWLSSDVVDSNEIYASLRDGRKNDRILYREKYLASHTFIITPFRGLNISLGESIVYSDRLQVSYLMPLMFFRLADHYNMRGSNSAGDNSQFFLGLSSRGHLKNTHLYGTMFIDEITLGGAFDPKKQRNQFGFTLGGSVTDLPVNNLTLTAEYTKIYPFVYRHYIPTQTYENAGYTLGHWMGHNSDMIYGSLKYRIIRGLEAGLWAQYIRKGENGIVDQQYTQPQPPFLFGLDTKYTYAGADVKYEIFHDAFVRGRFVYNETSAEQKTGGFKDTKFNEWYVSMYYGL